MNLVVLYGPPAVGKLTIARELSRLTGLKVLHNHLTIDVAKPFFEFGSPPFIRLLDKLRLAVIEEAVAQGLDLVFTVAYHHSAETEAGARAFLETAQGYGARVCLVHLTCSARALEARVASEERLQMGKLATVDVLRKFTADKDYESGYPDPDTLRIDNTDLPAEATARRIAKHYGLTLVSDQVAG
jgi:predicted kinase